MSEKNTKGNSGANASAPQQQPTPENISKEAANAPRQAAEQVLIEIIDAKDDKMLLAYMEDAATSINENNIAKGKPASELPQSQGAMRLAVFRFIADTAKLEGAKRKQAWQQFSKTATWFGANASQAAQALGLRTPNAGKADVGEVEA